MEEEKLKVWKEIKMRNVLSSTISFDYLEKKKP